MATNFGKIKKAARRDFNNIKKNTARHPGVLALGFFAGVGSVFATNIAIKGVNRARFEFAARKTAKNFANTVVDNFLEKVNAEDTTTDTTDTTTDTANNAE